MSKLEKLSDTTCRGIELLPLFLELREELNYNLGFKKKQLFDIINHKELCPDKQVPMEDIELLLLPHHLLRTRLAKIQPSSEVNIDTDMWLKFYFQQKYFANEDFESVFA